MLAYASTIFLSALLLFQIQPIITKLIQPWFGGTASVWTTCLVFFQAVLVLGYLYAHALTKFLPPSRQSVLHASLLAASLFLLPVIPGEAWRPAGAEEPAWRILGLLAVTIGIPYFLLSTTAPLLQAWSARAEHRHLPYRLYAVSNLAAVLALIAYPFLVEPFLATKVQAKVWSVLYAGFSMLSIYLSVRAAKHQPAVEEPVLESKVPVRMRLLWVLLAMLPSMLLMAVTNYLTQSIASIPFLWILPLAIYLITFIICFGKDEWASRTIFVRLLVLALMGMAYLLWPPRLGSYIRLSVLVYSVGLFICSMFAHGELVRRKPAPQHLTTFYLMVALGGAIGGFLVSIVSPLLSAAFFEVPITLAGFGILALTLTFRNSWRTDVLWVITSLFLLATIFVYGRAFLTGSLIAARNFYGTVRVTDLPAVKQGEFVRALVHGATEHGRQFLSPSMRRQPTSYYGLDSGIGLVMNQMKIRSLRVGVIGLGAGCVAAYGDEGDYFRFYEINPLVVRLSREYFTFLADSRAGVVVVPGDGRLSLERETPQGFDVLVVDAFSGGSIPVHMLVHETFEQYFRHLKPDGILALHITNTWFDLSPIVAAAAASFGAHGLLVYHSGLSQAETVASTWALLTRNGHLLDLPVLKRAGTPLSSRPDLRTWTDDYSNVFQIMK